MEQEACDGHGEKHGAVAAAHDLQGEQCRRGQEVPAAAPFEVPVQVHQAEGDPLDARHVELAHPHEARRREGERHPRDEGARDSDPDLAGQGVGPEPREDAREEGRHVHRGEEAARQREPREGEQRDPEEVLGVRQGVPIGEEDVRVEERQRLVHEGVQVPAERPEKEPRIRPHVDGPVGRRHAQGIGHDSGQGREERHEGEGATEAPAGRRLHDHVALSHRPRSLHQLRTCRAFVSSVFLW